MGLAKKGSRVIDVNGIDYRWALSPDSGYNVLIAQHAQANGAKLTVYITPDANALTPAGNTQMPITPSIVAGLITQALELGWPSTERTHDYICEMTADGTISKRN